MNRDEAMDNMLLALIEARHKADSRVVLAIKNESTGICQVFGASDATTHVEVIAALARGSLMQHPKDCDCEGSRFMQGVLDLFAEFGTISAPLSIHDEPAGRA